MTDLATTFSALGDNTRFAIVQELLASGERSVNELQKNADISPPAFSRHLKVLREAGMVTLRVDKQRRIYSVKPLAIQAIHAWVIEHQKFWQSNFDRLETALNEFEQKEDK